MATSKDLSVIAPGLPFKYLSVSFGMSTVEFEGGSTDQEDSGFSVSYTMGSMSLTAAANSSDNVGGTSGTDDTHKEIGLAFAF